MLYFPNYFQNKILHLDYCFYAIALKYLNIIKLPVVIFLVHLHNIDQEQKLSLPIQILENMVKYCSSIKRSFWLTFNYKFYSLYGR